MSDPREPALPRDIERTGWKAEWVNGLPDLLSIEGRLTCGEYLFNLSTMELKSCDATVGCLNAADYLVTFHGCDAACFCAAHVDALIYEVNATIAYQGGALCDVCKTIFLFLPGFMNFREI